MANKEKEIELKVKAEKISDDHLQELQRIIHTINHTQVQIGKIEAQKHALLHELSNTQGEVNKMQELLNKEYGTDDVNINNGTINWPEEKKDEK
mgnify:FL=1|tara:strand:+ start:2221 stop:2502 length:282 start_codon:yes stop_codon:yes gene_type:complete